MTPEVLDRVRKTTREIVESANMELVHLELKRAPGGLLLRVYIGSAPRNRTLGTGVDRTRGEDVANEQRDLSGDRAGRTRKGNRGRHHHSGRRGRLRGRRQEVFSHQGRPGGQV